MRLIDVSPTDLGLIDICEYKISIEYVIARKKPYTWSDPVKKYFQGDIFFGLYQVQGEPIEDVPLWIAHYRGGFLWVGALRIIREWNALDLSTIPLYNDQMYFRSLGGDRYD